MGKQRFTAPIRRVLSELDQLIDDQPLLVSMIEAGLRERGVKTRDLVRWRAWVSRWNTSKNGDESPEETPIEHG